MHYARVFIAGAFNAIQLYQLHNYFMYQVHWMLPNAQRQLALLFINPLQPPLCPPLAHLHYYISLLTVIVNFHYFSSEIFCFDNYFNEFN